MITKMKKLTFLVYHKEYEQFLQQIRELGAVHIVEKQLGEMDDKLQYFMQKRSLYKSVLQNMFLLADKAPEEKVHASLATDDLMKQYENLQAKIQDLLQQLPQISKEMAQLDMWGDFDWNSITRLEEAGLFVRFYSCSEKEFDEAWVNEHNAMVINERGGQLYFITVTSQEVELDREPLHLPDESLSQLKGKLVKTEDKLAQAREELKSFCKTYYLSLIHI